MVRTISACFTSKRCQAPDPRLKTKVILHITNQQYGQDAVYLLGVHTSFEKLMFSYCQARDLDHTNLRFIYNGELLEPRQTPAQLMMKDEDIIDVTTVLPEQGNAGPEPSS